MQTNLSVQKLCTLEQQARWDILQVELQHCRKGSGYISVYEHNIFDKGSLYIYTYILQWNRLTSLAAMTLSHYL